jgi:hypothetical protein
MLAKPLQTAVKVIFIFVVPGISTFISCSEENEPVVQGKDCFPTEFISKVTDEHEPDNNSHLKHTFFLDNENKILTETVEDLIDGSENHEVTYTYDNAGRLITIDKDYPADNHTTKELIYNGDQITEIRFQGLTESTYSYDPKGRLIEVNQYYPDCSGSPPTCSATLLGAFFYEYENDTSKNPSIARSSVGGWIEMTFDDKVGISPLFPQEVVVPYYNNPIRFVIKNKSGGILNTLEFSYVYNEHDYPTKMITNDGSVNESSISYKCL